MSDVIDQMFIMYELTHDVVMECCVIVRNCRILNQADIYYCVFELFFGLPNFFIIFNIFFHFFFFFQAEDGIRDSDM